MVLSDESITNTYTPDSTQGTLETITVPSGELYYVGDLIVQWDGNGPNSNHRIAAGIADPTYMDIIAPSFHDAPRGNRSGNESLNNREEFVESIQNYAYPGEDIRIGESSNGGDGTGNVDYALGIRRLI